MASDREEVLGTVTDDEGRRWAVERVGRTSGTIGVAGRPSGSAPADLIRFTCESHSSEPAREVTVPVGTMEQLTPSELKALFECAPRSTD